MTPKRLLHHENIIMGLSKNPNSPMYGNTVVTAVTLSIGEFGSKIAYFSHIAGTARALCRMRPQKCSLCPLAAQSIPTEF